MDVALFDFHLPPEQIAQRPAADRESARLLVFDRASGAIAAHTLVRALPDFLRPGDLLVVNDTKVFPARLLGRRDPSGGVVECLLVRRLEDDRWEALMHPGQKLHPGARGRLRRARARAPRRGPRAALPRPADHPAVERRRRRDVDARRGRDRPRPAAPLHPSPRRCGRPGAIPDGLRARPRLDRGADGRPAPDARRCSTRLAANGVERADVTLHVGYGTFKPVGSTRSRSTASIPSGSRSRAEAAAAINAALDEGRRVVAVGTTTTRALETRRRAGGGRVLPGAGAASCSSTPGTGSGCSAAC